MGEFPIETKTHVKCYSGNTIQRSQLKVRSPPDPKALTSFPFFFSSLKYFYWRNKKIEGKVFFFSSFCLQSLVWDKSRNFLKNPISLLNLESPNHDDERDETFRRIGLQSWLGRELHFSFQNFHLLLFSCSFLLKGSENPNCEFLFCVLKHIGGHVYLGFSFCVNKFQRF